MSFTVIFKYQDIDRELYKMEKEIMNSKEMKDVGLAKSAVADARESLIRLNGEAGEAFTQFEKAQSELNALLTSVTEIEKLDLATNDIGAIDYYEKKINELSDKIEVSRKEIDKVAARCDQIQASYEKASADGTRFMELVGKTTEKLNAFKFERAGAAKNIKQELDNLKKEIKPELLAAYEARRANGKLPAFVRFDRATAACVCGMDLPGNSIEKLKSPGDYTECPNCTRILIVTE